MLKFANLWDLDQLDDLEDPQHKVESLLAIVIASGLARGEYGRDIPRTPVGDMDGLNTSNPTLAKRAKQ